MPQVRTYAMPSVFSWVQHPQHQWILAHIPEEARFVGGAVRNTLQGMAPEDFDIATSAPPQLVISALRDAGAHVVPTGLSHGTVTAIYKGTSYEITTLRKDVATDGRHAQIAHTSCWAEDALRRDFTMNALYVDAKGTVYDYVGGLEDAQNHRVRFIGRAQARIEEDYLRILRFFRFSAFYGQTLDAEGLHACGAQRQGLSLLSAPRITKELLRWLQAPSPWHTLFAFIQHGLWSWLYKTAAQSSFAPPAQEVAIHQEKQASTLAMLIEDIESLWHMHANTLEIPPKQQQEVWTLARLVIAHDIASGDLLLPQRQGWHLYAQQPPCPSRPLPSGLALSRAQSTWCYEAQHPALNMDSDDVLWQEALLRKGTPCVLLWLMMHAWRTNCLLSKHAVSENNKKQLHQKIEVLQACKRFPPMPLTGGALAQAGWEGAAIAQTLQATRMWWLEKKGTPSLEACMAFADLWRKNHLP